MDHFDHEHTHEGEHSHTHGGEKTVAVLKYMLDHNIHHAAELSDIARQFDGEARHQLLHAVESFDQANGYLSAALELLKEKQDYSSKGGSAHVPFHHL